MTCIKRADYLIASEHKLLEYGRDTKNFFIITMNRHRLQCFYADLSLMGDSSIPFLVNAQPVSQQRKRWRSHLPLNLPDLQHLVHRLRIRLVEEEEIDLFQCELVGFRVEHVDERNEGKIGGHENEIGAPVSLPHEPTLKSRTKNPKRALTR
jgi:hypothetical protein